MAQKVQTLVDTVRFRLDSTDCEIDHNAEQAQGLQTHWQAT